MRDVEKLCLWMIGPEPSNVHRVRYNVKPMTVAALSYFDMLELVVKCIVCYASL